MNDHDQRLVETERPTDPETDVAFVFAAAEAGYFEVPREISLTRLAELEGIPDQEASERMRRGIKRIITDADRRR